MADIKLICGHYGCGKTNLAINMALAAAARGSPVVLVDLDIVNPYFRSSDYRELLEKAGVQVIAPNFSHTNLDLPSLPAAIYSVFEFAGEVIIDVGGDDVGATALGRFSKQIAAAGYEMLYVVNKYRALTSSAAEAARLLREIESACRLQATGVVNNSHLKGETTKATILDSLAYAEETAKLLCIPLLFTTAPRYLAKDLQEIEYLYPIDVHVKTSWEDY
ncbi:nucleotide-binding protein [Candidatus Methanomassiliicoccus intestinalis]|uniref:nucleotide-binding protein n=1 Tax=Candidatus Methanomassiliicoccus intestinalis TaxID=1406512 RepID=UPI0037DD9B32